jgi:prepilin-type N-terminal cleavage/methylation domain-containing protein
MKRSQSINSRSAGFTLVEVIATLVVVAVLSAFFIHFMGTALDHSWKSVDLVAGEAEAEGIMEQIIADYVKEMNSNPDTALATLKSRAENKDYDGNVVYDDDVVKVTMQYIDFDENGIEISITPGPSDLLKVTAQAPGNDLTVILPQSRVKSTDPIIEF